MGKHELWSIDILLVVIVATMENWHLGIMHIIQRRVLLPETIIIRMIYKFVPCGNCFVKIFFIYIFYRAQFQKKIIEIIFGITYSRFLFHSPGITEAIL